MDNNSQFTKTNTEPIAIIGFGLKFPQRASTPSGFWDVLVQGISARTETPADRWNPETFHRSTKPGHSQRPGTIKTTHGHYITDSLDRFDAPFFSTTPHEAECMDPQQRWLLEVTYHALENAGLSLDAVNGSNTSAYVGSFMNDFETMVHKDLDVPQAYHATGKASAILANRLSWFYNLKGPSVAVNTACSGSLVALHLACESLRAGETTMGLVCGSNLIFAPENSAGLSNLNFLSPDGICYAFDQRANGYARGEGVACLVIKPLSAALRDHDPIRAVIRATGVNSDGRTPGISQPSCDAQIDLMRRTYARFGLDPGQTRYFEAHGTGTQVGDPIEAEAIATVFDSGRRRSDEQPLYVGALKSNLGHLEGASGLAGVIKTIMVLQHGVIPPNIWYQSPNSAIKKEWGLEFPTAPTPWPDNGQPRRASVNSFGFGGTNAHAVLDGAPSIASPTNGSLHQKGASCHNGLKLLPLSAADEKAVARVCEAYTVQFVTAPQDTDEASSYLESLAFTLSQRRSHLPWRSFSLGDPDQGLGSLEWSSPVHINSKLQVCFVFTGQGAQWAHMGIELMEFDVFRRSMEDSDRLLGDLGCQFSILDILYDNQSSQLDQPEFSQPSCTVLQIALIELLEEWGVRPYAVVGHSSGEVAAAYCAGVISKSHALKLAFVRGVATSAAKHTNSLDGGMMAVRASVEKCQDAIETLARNAPKAGKFELGIAAYNSPQNLTLSGDVAQLEKLGPLLEEQGIMGKRLNVNMAYHNAKHMGPAAEIYRSMMEDPHDQGSRTTRMATPKCVMVSSVRDKVFMPGSDASEVCMLDYWLDNLVCPVRFMQAIQSLEALLQDENSFANTHFVEVGPHSTLKSAIKESLSEGWSVDKSYTSVLVRQEPALPTALVAAGRLHCLGCAVNLQAVNNQQSTVRNRVLTDLPAYPFSQSRRYWVESRLSKDYRFREKPRHDFLGTPASDWNALEPHWNNRLVIQEQPWIRDHKVAGSMVYPAAGMLVMAIEASRQVDSSPLALAGYRFRDVTFSQTIVVPESSMGAETQLRLRKLNHQSSSSEADHCYEFTLYQHAHGEWSRACSGSLTLEHRVRDGLDNDEGWAVEEHAIRSRESHSQVQHDKFYQHLSKAGLKYGPIFQMTHDISHGDGNQGVGNIDMERWSHLIEEERQSPCFIHPAALDCVIQVAFLGMTRGAQVDIPTTVPTDFHDLWISADISREAVVEVSAASVQKGPRSHTADYIAIGHASKKPLVLGSLTFTSIPRATVNSVSTTATTEESAVSLYQVEWKPDVDLAAPGSDAFTVQPDSPPESQEVIRLKEYACLLAINQVLDALDNNSAPASIDFPDHIAKYVDWMRHQVELIKASAEWHDWLSHLPAAAKSTSKLWETVASLGPEGSVIAKLCQQLAPIVKGEVDPLHILFADDTLSDYYRLENPPREVIRGVQGYVDCMAHANPNLRVVEIGAGTGGMTKYAMDILVGESHDGVSPRFSQYVFTDISPAFFKAAKDKFPWEGMLYKTLDIERSPADQGFDHGAFDLVIASNVLHATKDLSITLGNARKLLKPGGKLVLVEGTAPNLMRTSFIFGCLPGWWLSTEPYREWGPLVSVARWNELLQANYFTGSEFLVDGADKANCLSSGIISTARAFDQPNGQTPTTPSEVLIVRLEKSPLQQALATSISDLCKEGLTTSRVTSLDVADLKYPTDAVVVFLQTAEQFSFHDVDEKGYQALKTALGMAKRLLWVTHRNRSEATSFEQEAVVGLARSVMSETEGLNIVTLGLESIEADSGAAKHVQSVLQQYFFGPEAGSGSTTRQGEEIFEISHRLCLSRVVPAKHIGNEIKAIKKSDIVANHEDRALDALGDDEVEIEVEQASIQLGALAKSSQPLLGHEAVGIIAQTGSKASSSSASSSSSPFKRGDRVIAIIPNPTSVSKPRVRCPAQFVHHVPKGFMNNKNSTSLLPLDFVVAYDALYSCARLATGESILIRDGSCAFGQAAMQIAQRLGGEVFACFRSKNDARVLGTRYCIAEDRCLFYRGSRMAVELERLTGGRGVDVMLELADVGGKARPAWDCIAAYGRVVEVDLDATRTSGVGPDVLAKSLKPDIMFARTSLLGLLKHPDRLANHLRTIMSMISNKEIIPITSIHSLTLAEFEEGSDRTNQRGSLDKVVLTLKDSASAPIPPRFDPNATYVIAGGLGGLGKSIAMWQIRHGARNLVLLGRQGAATSGAREFIKECASMGASVFAPTCDISREKDVSLAFQQAKKRQMPAIKGCIQASMVLKSAMFEKMSLGQWIDTLGPKVQGSINLDRHLPPKLDFLIFLSSVCGVIGASGQSNYAFGCAYQDALARSKAAAGQQRAVSIDLGIVEGVGYTAEHKGAGSFMRSLGMQPIPEDYLLAMLAYYCDASRELCRPSDAQIVAGIMGQQEMQRQGIVRPRFHSRPLWRHLQQREKPVMKATTARPAVKVAAAATTSSSSQQTGSLSVLPHSQQGQSAAMISQMLCARISEVLAISPEDIEPSKPLHMYGVDSLVAMELRGWFQEALQKDVAVFEILSNRPIDVLAHDVASK